MAEMESVLAARRAAHAEVGRVAARARAGSKEDFLHLYAGLEKRVRSHALRLLGDVHEAEDTTQDAFLEAYRSLPRLADPVAFEAWLLRIAHNRAVDRARTMRRCRPSARAHDDTADESRDLPRVLRRSGGGEPSPLTLLLLRDAIDALPRALRDAVRLAFEEGLPCAEIARRQGTSVLAVKTRLSRARRRLRTALVEARPEGVRGRKSLKKTCFAATSR